MPILAVPYSISCMSLSYRVQEIWSHKITNAYRTMKHGLLQGLTAAIMNGMSQYLNTFLETSIFAVSNGTHFVSVEGRVQKIQSHKFTCVHQILFISWAHSSTSDGDVTILFTYPYELQSLLHPMV